MIKTFSPPKCHVYIKFLGIGPCSELIADKISLSETCFDFTLECTNFTTRNAFPSFFKDVLPILQENLVIHQFKCQFDADYVGRTARKQEVRIDQHIPNSK